MTEECTWVPRFLQDFHDRQHSSPKKQRYTGYFSSNSKKCPPGVAACQDWSKIFEERSSSSYQIHTRFFRYCPKPATHGLLNMCYLIDLSPANEIRLWIHWIRSYKPQFLKKVKHHHTEIENCRNIFTKPVHRHYILYYT